MCRGRRGRILLHLQRECVVYWYSIHEFSNLYTAVDTPARGRVVVCLVFVCLVFVCKYVLEHSWVSQLGHSRVSQHIQLEGTVLRGSRAGRRSGCSNHPSCVYG